MPSSVPTPRPQRARRHVFAQRWYKAGWPKFLLSAHPRYAQFAICVVYNCVFEQQYWWLLSTLIQPIRATPAVVVLLCRSTATAHHILTPFHKQLSGRIRPAYRKSQRQAGVPTPFCCYGLAYQLCPVACSVEHWYSKCRQPTLIQRRGAHRAQAARSCRIPAGGQSPGGRLCSSAAGSRPKHATEVTQ
jgi:hypothetical protein